MEWMDLPYWKRSKCPMCGRAKDRKALICLDCYAKIPHSDIRPPLEVLTLILREHKGNFTQIGKLFGVSDNAVRKWCKHYGISHHSKDWRYAA